MTPGTVREALESCREVADIEAEQRRDSQYVADQLRDLYLSLERDERSEADAVIAEWLISDDEKKRFDALGLIAEMKIVAARPALELLERRLSSDPAPGARFEMAKAK